MAQLPPGLLAYIKQGQSSPVNPMSLIPQQSADPTLQMKMQQAYKQKMADEAAQKIGGAMGQQAGTEMMGPPDLQGNMQEQETLASGIYEGASPAQAQQLEFAQELIESGSPLLQKRGMGMLNQIQSAIPTAGKQTTLMQNYQNYLGMLPEGEQPVPFNEFRRTGTTINIGGDRKGRWMTKDEKKTQGIPPENAVYFNSKGDPFTINRYTEGQTKSAGYAERMYNASKDVEVAMKTEGFDPASEQFNIAKSAGPLGNRMMSTAGQNYLQAANNWISANLRKESGAVLGEEEIKSEFRKWFPVYGDEDPVIEQKRKRREQVEKSMQKASGGMWSEIMAKSVPEGSQDLNDGTIKLPDGRIVRKKQ